MDKTELELYPKSGRLAIQVTIYRHINLRVTEQDNMNSPLFTLESSQITWIALEGSNWHATCLVS